jgi:hypothetical protein
MATHNPKSYRVEQDGTIILQSKHLGEIVEVHLDKEKRRFYGIRQDRTVIEHDGDCGSDFAQPVMLYKIYYSFETDSWGVGYRLKNSNENKWKPGFTTAREAWLYREALITSGVAEK